MTAHRLAPLFDFSSIAVVGASDNAPGGPRGYRTLQELGFQGRYYPVNPRASTVGGMKAYPNVSSLPEVPDMVIVAIPRGGVPAIIDECADLGVKAAVILSAGFLEIGEEGAALQERITATARTHGPLLVGPNCLGLVSVVNRCAAFDGAPPTVAGNVAVISNSGGLMNEVMWSGVPRGIGFSHCVSAGNEAGVTAADLIDYFVADPATDVVLAILEAIRDPALFVEACKRAQAARKPIVVLKMGRSEKGRQAVSTHTGATAGHDAVYSALFKQVGVVQVDDLEELVDMGMLFSRSIPILRTRRLERAGVIEISGGGKELLCDTCTAAGVELPDLSEAGAVAIAEAMHDDKKVATNPVDTGGGWTAPEKGPLYTAILEILGSEPNIDMIVSRYTVPRSGPIGALQQRVAEMQAARAVHPDRLFVILGRSADQVSPEWEEAVRADQLVFLQGYNRGPRALGRLAAYSRLVHGSTQPATTGPDPMAIAPPGRPLDQIESRRIVEAAGILATERRPGTSDEEAGRMVPGVELVLSAQRDPQFGPVILCSPRGFSTDMMSDFALRLAPVSKQEAEAMLDRLRGSLLLDRLDRAAVVQAICRLSDLMMARPDLARIDLNPVEVSSSGLLAVDARVELIHDAGEPRSE